VVPACPTPSASLRASTSQASTISEQQVRRARDAVPDAAFVQADFTALELEPSSFDAVVSFYAFNHVPRELLAPTLARIHSWLVPGGYLMTAFGTGDTEAWTGDWLGAPTFFSSFPRETNTRIVLEAGFGILGDELVTFTEPEGDVTFHWVLAVRPA
jgi:cyclopropane fatty-acyl-phospholipid synthase-like methyltransferase